MINNSIDINKTENSHLSSQTIEHKTTTHGVEKKSRFWHGEDTNMWSVNEKFIFTYNIFSFHNNWFCSITLSLVKCVPFILSRRFDNVYVYICNIYFNVFDILMFQVLLVIRQFHAVHFNGANSVHYFWSVYQRPGLCMPGLSHDKNR